MPSYLSSRILLICPLLFLIYWWIGEPHEVWGDEATLVGLAQKYWDAVDRDGFIRAIFFDERYPFLFFFLSTPFVEFSSDPIFGGRVFVGLVSLASLYLFHKLAKTVFLVGGAAADLSVLLLFSVGPFAEITKFFLLESVVVLFLIGLILVVMQFSIFPTVKGFALALGTLSLGVLAKFSFFIYALPVLFGALVLMISDGKQRSLVRDFFSSNVLAVSAIGTGFLSVPLLWYIYQLVISKSAVSGLSSMLATGHLNAYTSPIDLVVQVSAFQWTNFQIHLILVIAMVSLILLSLRSVTTYPQGTKPLTALWKQATVQWRFSFLISVTGVVIVPAVLAFIGLGSQSRWHVEYVFYVLLTLLLATQVPVALGKRFALILIFLGAGISLFNHWIGPCCRQLGLNFDRTDWIGRPSASHVGGTEIAQHIKDDLERSAALPDSVSLFFLYHEHRGAHFASVSHYLRSLIPGLNVKASIGAFFNRPVDIVTLFSADYWIVRSIPKSSETDDGETINYLQWFYANEVMLKEYLTEIGLVEGRYGTYRILRLERGKLSCGILKSQISYLADSAKDLKLRHNYGRLLLTPDSNGSCMIAHPEDITTEKVERQLVARFTDRIPKKFADANLSFGKDCNIERINNAVFSHPSTLVPKMGLKKITGWGLTDSKRGVESLGTYLRLRSLDGKVYFSDRKATVVKRPDAVQYFSNPLYENAGYEATVSFSSIPVGTYSLTIVMESEGAAILCDPGRKIVVKAGIK